MADETYVKFIYPPNFEGTFESGQKDFPRRYIILCTNISDGTGEDASIKANRTDMMIDEITPAGRLALEKIQYDVQGMTVKVEYDNDNDEFIAILSPGQDTIEYPGGYIPAPLDEDNEFDSGNIIFTTEGASSGDTYNIVLTVRPKE